MKKRIRVSGLLILFLSVFSLMAGAAETSDVTSAEVHFEKISSRTEVRELKDAVVKYQYQPLPKRSPKSPVSPASSVAV